jgi:PmbA protein
MSQPEQQLHQQIEWLLCAAKSHGISSAEVSVSRGQGVSVTVRQQQPEIIEHYEDQSVNIAVYCDGRKGMASTTDLREDSLTRALDAAYQIAQYTVADSAAGLPEVEDIATDWPELDLYHPWDLHVPDAVAQCRCCEQHALDLDARIKQSDGASITAYQGWRGYGNSHGFIGTCASSKHNMSLGLIAQSHGQMQRDYSYSVSRDPKQLWTPEDIAKQAVGRTVVRLNPHKIKTAKVPVIFAADLATGLFSHLLKAISGGSLYRHASFLLESIGQQVLPEFISVYEDPFVAQGLASCPFDAEGVQVAPRYIVEQGVIKGYILSSYSARRLNLKTTGNAGGCHNIRINHQDKTLDDLIRAMGTGLIVTDVIGQGVNLVTGDYSRGASGLWVENGQIQHPVEEITIAGNLKDMYRNIVAIANDTETRSSIQVGSTLIAEMTVGGNI